MTAIDVRILQVLFEGEGKKSKEKQKNVFNNYSSKQQEESLPITTTKQRDQAIKAVLSSFISQQKQGSG